MTAWLSIVGLGEDGLEGLAPAARALVDDAEVLVGGERHLELAGDSAAQRLTWESPLRKTVERLEGLKGRRVCVLASGDPMAYGIGVTLLRRFGADSARVFPGLSAFSLACARLGWPLAETVQLTLHGRPLELLKAHLVPGQRLLLLSEDATTPARVADLLSRAGFGPSRLHVLCHMGGPRERCIDARASDGIGEDVDDLNTLGVELVAEPGTRVLARTPGLPDEAFEHDGQMTKREVRAMTLAALAPVPGALLWDVGSGCGSVAIEWMRAADRTSAIAIERNADRRAMSARNALALGTPGLRVVAGSAPDALDGLEAPDAVFIGGGVACEGVIDTCWHALDDGGRIVANAVTLESEQALYRHHENLGGELVRIAVSRAEPVGRLTGWRPMMPVTQWRAVKP
jgi:precorrin-6Y C5,15-methyltransferase (decarboxylating)